jgi:enterochelin esterase-like enzyme
VLEPAFHEIALNWNDTLTAKGVHPTLREILGGHDWLVWCEEMPNAILWAWPGKGQLAISTSF